MTAHMKLFSTDDQGSNAAPPAILDDAAAQTALDDLRAKVDALRTQVTDAASRGAAKVAALSEDGADEMRARIRKAPALSLGAAVVVGSLVGLALTSRTKAEPTWRDRVEPYRAAVRDIDVQDLIDRARRTAASTGEAASGVIPGIERLAQSLSTMDTSAVQPALEKGAGWIKSVWNSVNAPR